MKQSERRETHILLSHRAEGNQPINFGSHKAEGNKTNTVFECQEGRGEGLLWCLRLRGGNSNVVGVTGLRGTNPFCLCSWAERNSVSTHSTQ